MKNDELTRTATIDVGSSKGELKVGVVLIHHPDPRYVGATCTLGIGEKVTLGRLCGRFVPQALDDSRISREHATLVGNGPTLHLQDLDSHNGTFVNGKRASAQIVQHGDVIGLGKVLLLVSSDLQERLYQPHPRLIGRSRSLASTLNHVASIASGPTSVLVLGESGVGKELIAREIHLRSERRGPLTTVNCATMPDSIVQSELFGHTRGAFSGADQARQGLVRQAHSGTLFLDEVGDASELLQVNLLRTLQEGEVRPVGADALRKVDVRFIAATNRDLPAMVRQGVFREDLYSRLTGALITIDPLRKRREDVLWLARHFLAEKKEEEVSLSTELALRLILHDWPGNIRTLQSVMSRLDAGIDGEPLPVPSWLEQTFAQHARADADSDEPVRRQATQPDSKEELTGLLEQHGGNVSALARTLGVSRNTLYRWFSRFGI